jgi:hypothetical protein
VNKYSLLQVSLRTPDCDPTASSVQLEALTGPHNAFTGRHSSRNQGLEIMRNDLISPLLFG